MCEYSEFEAVTIEETYLPITLTAAPMSDELFAEFCAEYPDYFIEATAEGDIIIMPPSYTLNGIRNANIGCELANWAQRDGHGVVTNINAGFVLPNGARRFAYVAWTMRTRIANLEGFWHFCPDFVIELRSHFDRLRVLQKKMEEWISNGAQLGWLIDAERHAVEIYRPGYEPEIREDVTSTAGEGPVDGFVLDLAPVWDPLGL